MLCKSASSELNSPHQLAVDKNYHTACPKVLYRADQDHRVFPKIYLDQVDRKHVYLAFQNQVSASMEMVTCRCLVSKWRCVFSDKACPRVQLQLLHDRTRLLVLTRSVLCVVQLWKQVQETAPKTHWKRLVFVDEKRGIFSLQVHVRRRLHKFILVVHPWGVSTQNGVLPGHEDRWQGPHACLIICLSDGSGENVANMWVNMSGLK